jgi:malate dehydrogenase
MTKENDCLFCFVEEESKNDICIGVPCIIGKMVLKKLLIELNDKEKATFAKVQRQFAQ